MDYRDQAKALIDRMAQSDDPVSILEAALVECDRHTRERCARIAEGFMPSSFRDGGIKRHEGQTYHRLPLGDIIGIARDDRARVIAYAIRAETD